VDKVHVRVAWHYEFMPVSFSGKTLTIAVNLPLSIRAEDEIRLSLGCEVNMLLARKDQILDSLKKYYGLAADTVDRMMGYGRADFGDQGLSFSGIEDIEKKAEEASVARLVNQIILEAYKKRATDIHIEPYRGKVSLRYRIDGKLHDQPVSDDFMRFLPPILSRVKIIANLNIVERRVPQDGKAIVKITDQVLDLRVSFMPTPHGESVVIRILPAKVRWDLANLGLLKDDVAKFDALLKNTSGILLVTGPTGSGKTTTLYSCIDKINTKDRKILSIEDPIEYEITGITQIQVNPEVGLTFARGLRSMLRQDPDVMMVGEIRDKETAEIAIRVALTGHLVLSTLHTNDAASGVTRLMDIGIPPYLLESTVKAFIAQRLVRVICDGCSEEDRGVQQSVKERIVRSMGSGSVHALKVYKGRGCEKCSFTGFHGRTAIFEILELTDEIRKMITLGSMASEINKVAVEKNGMRTLLQDGWIKVARGITTPDEILNVCQ
jgi:type II secretory ATPase GspE/PulE/Tfp pilus assembly ATPase PilB-like protein